MHPCISILAHICTVLRARTLFCSHLHCFTCPHPILLTFASFCVSALCFAHICLVLRAHILFFACICIVLRAHVLLYFRLHRFAHPFLFSFAIAPFCVPDFVSRTVLRICSCFPLHVACMCMVLPPFCFIACICIRAVMFTAWSSHRPGFAWFETQTVLLSTLIVRLIPCTHSIT